MSDFEQKIKANLKANLDEQVQNLDADTRQLLAAARRKALNQPTRKSWFKKEYLLPAGSLALCGLLVVFILVNPKTDNSHANIADNQAQQQTTDRVAALELLNDAEDNEETIDPDFYLWVDETLATESVPHAV
jgi:hypothetical protein